MELDFIEWLRARVTADPRARLGLSDDAAVLTFNVPGEVVVTTDLLTDGVDFELGKHEPRRIGRQALAANLSDLAAMAARPHAAFVSLALPRDSSASGSPLHLAIGLYEGILPLAAEFDCRIAGGDTNTFAGPLAISVTALGTTTGSGPLTRAGGKPGDWLLVTGALGGSILGHMLDFTPRVREAIMIHEQYEVHAAIDISDGLALDASRLAAASDCGALLNLDRVPISQDAIRLARQEKAVDIPAAALSHALGDGQDFELLLAADPQTVLRILNERPLDCEIAHVGKLIPERGLWRRTDSGELIKMEPTGWRH